MKNLHKVTLSIMVGVLAIVFNAFTSEPENGMKINRNAKGEIVSVTNTYFRRVANASTSTDSNASHYVYSNTALANCTTGTANICTSRWTTANAPANGQSPADAGSPSFVGNNTVLGIYNGN